MLAACPMARLLMTMGEVVPVAGSGGVCVAAGSSVAPTSSRDEGAVTGSSAGLCRLGRGELGAATTGLGPRTPQDPAVVSTEGVPSVGDGTGCLPPSALSSVTAKDRALLVLVAFAVADGMAAVALVTM